MKTPAVIYAAKSTQDKNKSIPTQVDDGRRKCADEDWEVITHVERGVVKDHFKDENFSAYSGNRGPGLKAATELAAKVAAERGCTCMLVAQHSDRFARGAGDKPGASDSLIEIWHRMRRASVHLRTDQNDAMMERPVTVAVASEQAHEESKRKSKATAAGHRRRRKLGKAHGGRRRYGYRFGPDAELISEPTEQLIVRRIFDEFIAGRTYKAIMRGLLADGAPTTRGGKWHEATVREILMNPLYAGKLRTKDGVVPGLHEPCVSVETFEKAEQLRLSRGAASSAAGRRTSGKHLFRKGLLRCGLCGGSMVPRTTRPGKSRPRRAISETYNCYEHGRDLSLCAMTPVKRELVDIAVYRYFEQVGLDVESSREQLVEERSAKLAEVGALAAQAELERQRAEERLARVRRDYADGKIDANDWNSFRDELSDELEAATAEVGRLARNSADVEGWGVVEDAEAEVLEHLVAVRRAIAGEVADGVDLDAVRAALSRLFDRFTLRAVGPGDRVHVELAWQGGYILEPTVREQAIEGYTSVRPVLRREPITGAPGPRQSDAFGPILIPAGEAH